MARYLRDRELQREINAGARAFMLHPVLHVWSKAVTALTAETLLELFQEAVDLRPLDPRTGIW